MTFEKFKKGSENYLTNLSLTANKRSSLIVVQFFPLISSIEVVGAT
jgi:hypothetical protein